MRIIRVQASSFCLFESVDIGLASQGLIWLGGTNKDTDAADSNGSGKSTIFKLVTWGLYGKCIDSKGGDEVIRNGAKVAKVTIDLEDSAGGTWRLVRERRVGVPKLSVVKSPGAADEGPVPGARAEMQEVVDAILGMDYDAFRNTVMFGQRDFNRFIVSKDADRKTMLHSILGTMIYRACHAVAKAENNALKVACDAASTQAATLSAKMEEHDVGAMEASQEKWESERGIRKDRCISLAKAKIVEAKGGAAKRKKATEIRADNDVDAAKLAFAEAETGCEGASEARQALYDAFVQAASNARECEKAALDAHQKCEFFNDGECPECGSDLAGSAPTARREALEADYNKAHDKAEVVRAAKSKKADALGVATRALDAAKQAKVDAKQALQRAIDLESEAKQLEIQAVASDAAAGLAREYAAEAKRIATETNPHTEALESANGKLADYAAKLEANRAEQETLAIKRSHTEFWARGFSDQGLPSFVLDSAMPYITERANHYLNILSDGDITMLFSTQRELKSSKGEMRDEIGVSWIIEGEADYPPSGGQLKKMEIATDLALMDLVATRDATHVDLLMMDEVLDGLDREGASRVVTLLHELRKTRGTILVISHQDDLADAFEKAWRVTKEGGKSVLHR